ncbi:MAG: sulfatase-like hydrolase/transferase [Planctomycetaceae bacterium]|nr:sulfatase-like hydrolase/transferase [Planctomycetaceae bacterium]
MRTLATLAMWTWAAGCVAAAADRPNILWISAEDISPDLGCYGDPYAATPNLDRFAAEGVRFTRCFTHAGVCAPSRSGLITGMYPPSIGTQHMRCKGVPPANVRCFPEYPRAAGYYCTNNAKTDYQFDAPDSAWDESSNRADWRGRGKDQPFFCVINFTTTHESQIRDPSPQTKKLVSALPAEMRHDPSKAVVPPYYPDTPVVRRDLANYADNLSALDGQVAEVLQRLEADGLADDTIVWFWGDHGRGLPRCKRWLYDSGTRVPLMIRVPEKWRNWAAPGAPEKLLPGAVNDDLVAFVDFAPTVLSLAGLTPATHLQGQTFLGPKPAEMPRKYVYGHRDRMDETYDLIRMVRDERFKYLRNFMPDVSYAQDIWYMNQMPTLQEMRRLHAEGQLQGEPALYFRANKPVEELFDTERDPYELHNLALDPQYADVLRRMRTECLRWMISMGDTGLIPEPIFDELKRPGGKWQQAPQPRLAECGPEQGIAPVILWSSFPGASVVYATLPSDAPKDLKPTWKLLSAPAIWSSLGDTLLAKTCRIGFRDSEVLRWTVGRPIVGDDVYNGPRHWREVVDESPLLSRLLAVKSLDFPSGAGVLAAYEAAIQDEFPAVRYWALRGAVRHINPDRCPPKWGVIVRQIRDADPSPLLQVVAAQALAKWSNDESQVRFLAKKMQSDPQDSLRLYAATALRELGEQARPVLPELEAATKSGEYVGRVSQDAVARLRSTQ